MGNKIKEIENEKFTMIGHHSHTHEYLIEKATRIY